ncbi:MAG: AI-2E family transporter [Phycisphaerae bacterium]|nr:AI-2E family transporter [Saprospiraceae bacterium]
MSQIPATPIRQLLLILLIAVIFGVLFWNLHFFVPALLGSYTLYVLLKSPLLFLTVRWKWPIKYAAMVLLLLSFAVIFFIFNGLYFMVEERIISLFENSDKLRQDAEALVRNLEAKYGVSLLTAENMKSFGNWAVGAAQGLVGATVNGLGLLLATFFLLWFMLTEGKAMEQSFFDWMPLRHENVTFVRKQLNDMVWGNAVGIPLMAVVQGLAGLLIYWLTGVQDLWMWFAITCISSMIPLIGVAMAFIPISIIFLSQGEEGKALLIVLYGLLVIGTIDNFARMWLMKKINHTHPLVTLFGVVVGLQLFGFIGFVFGPILISLFILLLHIYHKEFHPTPARVT